MESIVRTKYGKVCGERIDDVIVWKGIPFAKPPVGKLRFMPPEEPECWEGIRDSISFGAHAMQPAVNLDYVFDEKPHTWVSEDCLTLNIWSGASNDDKKPVVVWIHPGGFYGGEGYESGLYDGTQFARDGVVFVTIQYRLCGFGFLYLDEVSGGKYRTGNSGLLDEIRALEWIHDNISGFGGDPGNVTLVGQSAGAMSIADLLVMPAAKGLFHKAIMESIAEPALPKRIAAEHTLEFLSGLGLGSENYEKLWEMSAQELMEAVFKYPAMYFGPVADGYYIPEHPLEVLGTESMNPASVIIGGVSHEYKGFTDFSPDFKDWSADKIEALLRRAAGEKWDQLRAIDPSRPFDQEYYNELMTDICFHYPTIRAADRMSERNPVWMFKLGVGEAPDYACVHAAGIVYVFNTDRDYGPYKIFPGTREQAKRIHDCCVRFAKTGKAVLDGIPTWEPYKADSRKVMVITNTAAALQSDPYERRENYYDILNDPNCYIEVII